MPDQQPHMRKRPRCVQGEDARVKAPGTPTITNFPELGKVTEFSGEASQSEAGGAGSFEPAEMAMLLL
jgi:hypothetical protein